MKAPRQAGLYTDTAGSAALGAAGPAADLFLPFLLSPAGKDYLWGGTRLRTEYGKNIDMTPLAETWECSAHPDGPSAAASGVLDGLLLPDILWLYPELLGRKYEASGELPILVKFIDAEKDLSVQVHPDDGYAAEHENGQRGKSELWYVVAAGEGASLVCGLKQTCTKDEFRKSAEDGTLCNLLNRVPVHKGDAFFINSGTVHAIGAGTLIAEIQENSNLTYRVFDYNRVGADGKKRELHTEKALAVANLGPAQPEYTGILPCVKAETGIAGARTVCECPYFSVTLLDGANGEISGNPESFRTLLSIGGEGRITTAGRELAFKKGECIFIPAADEPHRLEGEGKLLLICC